MEQNNIIDKTRILHINPFSNQIIRINKILNFSLAKFNFLKDVLRRKNINETKLQKSMEAKCIFVIFAT